MAIHMTRAVSISQFRPEFSDFLIAPVGNDSNIAASSQPPEHGIGARAPAASTSSPITLAHNGEPV
jgi:hypothetical protein